MDRDKWNDIVGGSTSSLIDDLEWKLFQARRCIATQKREYEEKDRPVDADLIEIWENIIIETRVALAALYRHLTRPV